MGAGSDCWPSKRRIATQSESRRGAGWPLQLARVPPGRVACGCRNSGCHRGGSRIPDFSLNPDLRHNALSLKTTSQVAGSSLPTKDFGKLPVPVLCLRFPVTPVPDSGFPFRWSSKCLWWTAGCIILDITGSWHTAIIKQHTSQPATHLGGTDSLWYPQTHFASVRFNVLISMGCETVY